jgi:hypothetical protein
MSRDIPSAMVTVAASDSFPPAFFVELDWPSGTVRAWGGYGDIVWGGNTWIGTGHLGEIGDVAESTDRKANGVPVRLSGIPSEEIAEAMAGDAQMRPGRIYLGALQADGTLVSDPLCIFDGLINYCVIDDDGKTSTVTVQLDKEGIAKKSEPRRYSHEDQQIDFPGDLFFEYLAGNIGKDFPWGKINTYAGGTAPGSGVSGDDLEALARTPFF